MNSAQLLKRVKKFINTKVLLNNGEHEKVTEKDLDELDDIIHAIMALHWERDYKDRLPVQVTLVDTTHFEGNSFGELRHNPSLDVEVEFQNLRVAEMNNSIASEQLRRCVAGLRFAMERKIKNTK